MTRGKAVSTVAAGSAAEAAAATFLRDRGYHVLERNFRCRGGEIDLIALDGGTLVFIEVKMRRTLSRGAPIEAVTPLKQARVARAAQSYLAFSGRVFPRIRFDVISVMRTSARTEITHFKAAFEAI
ncbi:MAG TPA: YraN family protein [Candidatus Eremiobacteraceae bacterium]|nr:YraN family protein [Candidatus Eremiobacteraceae bacterium]